MAEKKETKWKHLMEQTLTEHKKKKKKHLSSILQ